MPPPISQSLATSQASLGREVSLWQSSREGDECELLTANSHYNRGPGAQAATEHWVASNCTCYGACPSWALCLNALPLDNLLANSFTSLRSLLKSNLLRAPGWLRWLSVQLQLRSRSCGPWVRALHLALCWQLRAWNLLWILCLPCSLSLPPLMLCLCLSKINTKKFKNIKFYI